MRFPTVWSSRRIVKVPELANFESFTKSSLIFFLNKIVYFFCPSGIVNSSKFSGAFILFIKY
jgi:hypothetical protein